MRGKLLDWLFTLDIPILMLYVYLVKEKINLFNCLPTIEEYAMVFLGVYYIIVIWLWGRFLLYLSPKLSPVRSIEKGAVKATDSLSDNYILKVISMFLVALRLYDIQMFVVFTLFIYILTKNATLNIFSPILTLHGYKHYYFIRHGVRKTLITKRCLKDPRYLEFSELYRLNEYTYILLDKKLDKH